MALNPAAVSEGASNTEHIRTIEPEEEESRRPENSPVYQQTLDAWSPYLTPWKVVICYIVIGLLFVPLGAFLAVDSGNVTEYRYQYDGEGSDGDDCKITDYKEGKQCTISFDVEEDMKGPVYVYYELSTFYQNHATYVASVDTDQLEGSTSTSGIDDCDPLTYNGSLVLHPGGLVANTLFNDIIELTSGQVMDETGIAWKSDIEDKYAQPDGFVYAECDDPDETCAACLTAAGETDSSGGTEFISCGLWQESDTDVTYAYYYPNEDETQYLYETFPEVISPIKGVTDEHFIVWMRTSGKSHFRKLYGSIEDTVSAGDTLTFDVTANFIVEYYDGTKSLVVSTTNSLGGRNKYWGQSLITLGACIWGLAALLGIKEYWFPREMGDMTKLVDEN